MKNIKVLDEHDIIAVVCKHFDVAPSKVELSVTKIGEDVSVEVSVEVDSGLQVSM